ncbi:MAG: hypothetical protein M3040_14715 [Bacteroidota bacterium]|nr:hypothetical protein [Bacteroidota bacterium]
MTNYSCQWNEQLNLEVLAGLSHSGDRIRAIRMKVVLLHEGRSEKVEYPSRSLKGVLSGRMIDTALLSEGV